MRNIKRIPIILDALENKPNPLQISIQEHRCVVEPFWLENQDLRLTQVMVHFGMPNYPGSWFYKEDEEVMEDFGLLKLEEIGFWGVNFDKEGNRLPETEYKLLKDLDTNHIENILKDMHFFQVKSMSNIHPKYLKYFLSRVEDKSQIL